METVELVIGPDGTGCAPVEGGGGLLDDEPAPPHPNRQQPAASELNVASICRRGEFPGQARVSREAFSEKSHCRDDPFIPGKKQSKLAYPSIATKRWPDRSTPLLNPPPLTRTRRGPKSFDAYRWSSAREN